MNKPLNFYPGPSALYPEVEKYLKKAFQSGILEQNHRSEPFMRLLEETILRFKSKLNVPKDYSVFFVSSATEAWEIVNQSLAKGNGSFLFNGDFGRKWFEYCIKCNDYQKVRNKVNGVEFGLENTVDEQDLTYFNDFIALVSSETSNGTQVKNESINAIRLNNKESLIFVDATSNMAGVELDFALADVWLASSQKCFGLPSGLGIMVVSPCAIEKAKVYNEQYHYNSLLNIYNNFSKFQTPYTPNILGIYLMNEVLKKVENVSEVHQKIKARATHLYECLSKLNYLNVLIHSDEIKSDTIIALELQAVNDLKTYLKNENIIIGNGYGAWKENTLRIANFPAIPDLNYEILLEKLTLYK